MSQVQLNVEELKSFITELVKQYKQVETEEQPKIQAIEEGFNSMKDMIEQKTIDSLKNYKEHKENVRKH